jgi:hypothetical protein
MLALIITDAWGMVVAGIIMLGCVDPGIIMPTRVTCNKKLAHVIICFAFRMGHILGHSVIRVQIHKITKGSVQD